MGWIVIEKTCKRCNLITKWRRSSPWDTKQEAMKAVKSFMKATQKHKLYVIKERK